MHCNLLKKSNGNYLWRVRAGISPYYDENGKVKGCKGEESQKIKNNNGNE